MPQYIIEIKELRKYYGSGIRGLGILALDGIDLQVPEGSIFGLLGPNGAGKSTAIKILLGFSRQNSALCLVSGNKASPQLRKRIGYLPEAPYFYKFLTGFEMVRLSAELCGMARRDAASAARRALELVGLGDAADRRIGLYSKGMVQRVGLAQATVHNPDLVILDEPASGLDPIGAADMADSIRRLRGEGKTVLMSSHIMSEVESLCTDVAILSQGKIAASGNLDSLLERGKRTILELDGADGDKIKKISDYAESMGVSAKAAGKGGIPLEKYFRKVVR